MQSIITHPGRGQIRVEDEGVLWFLNVIIIRIFLPPSLVDKVSVLGGSHLGSWKLGSLVVVERLCERPPSSPASPHSPVKVVRGQESGEIECLPAFLGFF